MDFGTILIVVSIVAALVAAASYWGSGRIYSGLGREGGLEVRRDPPAVAEGSAEAREETRQMLEAKSTRRQARGEEPLDVDAELASLTPGPRIPRRRSSRRGSPARRSDFGPRPGIGCLRDGGRTSH